jgi:hypothetical protein
VVVAGLIAGQAIRPSRANPPANPAKSLFAATHPPATVGSALDRACRDCHTNNTVWPWYTNVAPISWWIIDHVREGRRRVSFSDWADYDPSRQQKELTDICRRVERHNMPLTSYLMVHRDARLTDAERQAICEWTQHVTVAGAPVPQRSH